MFESVPNIWDAVTVLIQLKIFLYLYFLYNNTNLSNALAKTSLKYTVGKKNRPPIEFAVTFRVLKMYLQDFTCLYFHHFKPSVKVSWKSMKYLQITVTLKYRGVKKQVSEIFRILQNC